MPRTVNEYFQPVSTGVHNNIDNLILEAELDKFAQTGSIRADKRPKYIGGVDPVVENIAMGPIMTLKSLGSIGRDILKKTGLRNPVSHYTKGESAKDILEAGTIKGASKSFPGQAFKSDRPQIKNIPFKQLMEETGSSYESFLKGARFGKFRSPSVSVTRDPMFLKRPHNHVGTDIRFVMDRDELVKKGFKIQPFTEPGGMPGYSKTLNSYGRPPITLENYKKMHGHYPNQMNPRFEFEERVRGYIPTENIKLIDILQLPLGESDQSHNMLKLLSQLSKTNIPIIKSNLVKERLGKLPMYIDYRKQPTEQLLKLIKNKTAKELKGLTIPNPGTDDILQLLQTPTYKFDPFEKVR